VRPYVFLVLLLLLLPLSTFAQRSAAFARDTGVIEAERTFVDAFSRGDYATAYGALRGLQLFSDAELDSLRDQTDEQLTRAANQFGQPLGWELVTTERAGSRMEQSIYLVYYESLPLRIRFVWYNGADGWRLYTLVWNDEVSNLFGWE
jgi:hypothetical protein